MDLKYFFAIFFISFILILIAPLVRTGLYYTYFNEILLSVCFKVAFLLENNECKNGIVKYVRQLWWIKRVINYPMADPKNQIKQPWKNFKQFEPKSFSLTLCQWLSADNKRYRLWGTCENVA